MNSPYGIDWGPATTVGVVFNIIYLFFGVGLFLLFVMESGKTMPRAPGTRGNKNMRTWFMQRLLVLFKPCGLIRLRAAVMSGLSSTVLMSAMEQSANSRLMRAQRRRTLCVLSLISVSMIIMIMNSRSANHPLFNNA